MKPLKLWLQTLWWAIDTWTFQKRSCKLPETPLGCKNCFATPSTFTSCLALKNLKTYLKSRSIRKRTSSLWSTLSSWQPAKPWLGNSIPLLSSSGLRKFDRRSATSLRKTLTSMEKFLKPWPGCSTKLSCTCRQWSTTTLKTRLRTTWYFCLGLWCEMRTWSSLRSLRR